MERDIKDGLSIRPSYDQLVKYIEADPTKIKMPNRVADMWRWDFRMTEFDNWGVNDYKMQDEVQRRSQYFQGDGQPPSFFPFDLRGPGGNPRSH